MKNYVSHLESALDGTRLSAEEPHTLHRGRPIWVRYDLEAIGQVLTRDMLASRPPSLWRYRELLPVRPGEEVTLGEGMTPPFEVPTARRAPRLAQRLGQGRIPAAHG